MNEPYTAAEVANALGDSPQETPPVFSVGRLLLEYPKLREPVIDRLLRRGETMNLIAPPKTGKSWLVLSLAICAATARRWLDTFETVAANVLIIDNELHAETLAHRVPKVAAALGVDISEIAETVSVRSLRGKLGNIFSLDMYLESVQPDRPTLVVLDAFYRFLPPKTDENDNGAMANIYNHIDGLADRHGCSFVLIHHASKGSQSGKSVTDVGAGAGSQSRATDTHLVMRPHAEPGAVVLEAAVRSWAPLAPIVLRWQFPLWKPAPELDPSALHAPKPPRRREEPKPDAPPAPDWTVESFVAAFVSSGPRSAAELREAAKGKPGLSSRRFADLLEIAESRGLIHRWRVGRAHRVSYATVPQPAPEETPS